MKQLYDIMIKGGENIRDKITEYVMQAGWEEAVILGAVGSVEKLEFTAPVENELPLRTGTTPCHGAAEILSFTGEIMKREKMDPALEAVYPDKSSPLFVHIHASCAIVGGHVCGGGLRGGRAFRALRVFIVPVEN